MGRSRRSPRLLFLLFLAGMTTVIIVGVRTPPVQTRKLPDGSTISLAAITSGPDHRFVRRAPWASRLSRLLPGPLGGVLGVYTRENVPDGTPVLWMTYGNLPPGRSGLSRGDIRDFTVFDEHGCETSALGQTHWFDSGVFSISLSAYPRAGRGLGIRGYNYGRKEPVFEILLPDWKPQRYAQWKPERLPIIRRQDGVEWTLEKFTTGVDFASPDQPPQPNERGRTSLLLVPRHDGELTQTWRPIAARIVGASGNVYDPGVQFSNPRWTGNGYRLTFVGNLFPEETAWKVQVELAPAPDAVPAGVKTYRFKGVPASQPGPASSWLIEAPNDWVPLPSGGRLGVAEVAQNTRALPCVGVQIRGPRGSAWPILLEVRDQRGRSLLPWRGLEEVADFDPSRGLPAIHMFEMPLKGIFKDTRTVDVTLAVTETRRIEFLAAPMRPGKP